MKTVRRFWLLGMLLVCSAATAHTHLVRSIPADGAELASAPTEAVLIFAEPVTLTALRLESSDGIKSTLAAPDGAQAEVHLKFAMLAPGRYRISWRGASADGHVMTGSISFTVNGSAAR